jgi:hypothetical protein
MNFVHKVAQTGFGKGTNDLYDRAQWVSQIRNFVEVHEQGVPQFRHMLVDTKSYKKKFQSPHEKIWEYHLEGTKDSAVDRALSKSYIAIFCQKIRNRMKSGESLIGLKKFGLMSRKASSSILTRLWL